MTEIKEKRVCGDRLLLVFGQKACARRRLVTCPEGECCFYFSADELMLKEAVRLPVIQREGMYFLGEEKLYEDQPFYYDTPGREKLMLILTKTLAQAERAGRLWISRSEVCRIGKAYKNRVFYDCHSLIGAEAAELRFADGRYQICPRAEEGIYLNGRKLDGEKMLSDGDQIDIYGLHLQLCGELFLCVCFAGAVRAAGEGAGFKEAYRRGAMHGLVPVPRERVVERKWEEEQKLYTGEREILTPRQRPGREGTPLLLSIGPSMTMVLPMFFMAMAGSRIMNQGSSFYLLSLVMGVCSAALALFWGVVNYGYKRYTEHRLEKQRIMQYREYLVRMREEITGLMEHNRKVLEARYPPAASFLGTERPGVLWNRYYRQKDFLFLRLGTGSANSRIPVRLARQSGDIVPDRLYQEGGSLAEEFQKEDAVPLGIDFFDTRQLGIEMDTDQKEDFEVLYGLLVQLAACHCYTEVKVACFYDKTRIWQMRFAQCIRWMPHLWTADRRTRFLAGDEKESGEIIPALMTELEKEQADEDRRIPWYLVLVLNPELVQGETLYSYLTEKGGKYPVSTVFAGKEKEAFPKSCLKYLICKGGEAVISKEDGEISIQSISLERTAEAQAQEYFRQTAGLKVRETGMEERIPEQADFLGLYGCGHVKQLEILRRWQENNPEKRLKVPVGRGAGGKLVSLDIHEKFHGPHGLIAGTTGFGKSELILTFLLSIAVNFAPEDVNFFMIDYKGGGTGNALLGLPHCAGVISNLSGKQIKRAMSAITSENKRRQKLLGEHGVNHIDAYTRLYREGRAAEPLPHLILVVDEFAQLRKEEPEFMQEIISLSQVGRSLGIHLILATQKPAGTVDDRIWSNARFHLCLKVQDRQDSMDMLHNGDAALLTTPGQCYLQIGSHEYYELFQTGYCGEAYREEAETQMNTELVEQTGRRICLKGEKEEKRESQLEAVVSYVNHIAEHQGRAHAKPLWMPELPERISFAELAGLRQKEKEAERAEKAERAGETERAGKTGKAGGTELLLGLCDDPENQRQFPFSYLPEQMGHLILCGGPQSGKSGFMQMLFWQLLLSGTEEGICVLGADMSQRSMKRFAGMPNVLGVLLEKGDKDIFFYHLERLFQKKKEASAGEGAGLPAVFLLIDNFAAMYGVLDEGQQELLLKLAREGMGYGIYLIMSASSPAEIPGRIYEKVKTTLALAMSDRFAYGDILRKYHMDVLPKDNTPGRGLCRQGERILEFQGAYWEENAQDFERLKTAEQTETAGRAGAKKSALEPFPHLPKPADYEQMRKDYCWKEDRIPLGYSLVSGRIRELRLEQTPVFLLSCGEKLHGQKFLANMEQSLRTIGKEVVWVNKDECLSIHRQAKAETCFLTADLAEALEQINRADEERSERMLFWQALAEGRMQGCFLAGAYSFMQDSRLMAEPLFRELSAHQRGIHLGGNGGAQRVFSFEDLGYAQLNRREAENTGYWKQGPYSRTERILVPGILEEER